MPRTALLFLLGSIAICGLPPLNGFISELLIYLGLFRVVATSNSSLWGIAAFSAPALALIGGLALLCFVKVYGAVFLGEPRTSHAMQRKESGVLMIGPMVVIGLLCLMIGLLPFLLPGILAPIVSAWIGTTIAPEALSQLTPFAWLSGIGFVVLSVVAIGLWLLRRAIDRTQNPALETWSCGYVQLSPSVQYTASSFAQMMVDLFEWVLFPTKSRTQVEGLFPQAVAFHSQVPDTVFDRLVIPFFRFFTEASTYFRFLQQGRIQAYILYIFITLLVLLFLR